MMCVYMYVPLMHSKISKYRVHKYFVRFTLLLHSRYPFSCVVSAKSNSWFPSSESFLFSTLNFAGEENRCEFLLAVLITFHETPGPCTPLVGVGAGMISRCCSRYVLGDGIISPATVPPTDSSTMTCLGVGERMTNAEGSL